MPAFAVTGTATPLGARVVAGLGGAVVAAPIGSTEPVVLNGARCLVSLAVGPRPAPGPGGAARRLAQLRRVLAAAEDAGVSRLVHLSSAVVYGSARDTALPLADDAPVRPDPGLAWAVELAEAERLVAEWRNGGPGRVATILRPALVLAPGDDGFLARALGGLRAPRAAGDSCPVQFVHVEDAAAAVVLCATAPEPFDGPLNVAPDGWVGDVEAVALSGLLLPTLPVPARLVRPVRRVLWATGLAFTPPQAEPYARHSWVVAADRLRALGWEPSFTTEEAIVATTTGSTLATLSPHRRQQVLLALTASLVGSVLLLTVLAAKRGLRRSRR